MGNEPASAGHLQVITPVNGRELKPILRESRRLANLLTRSVDADRAAEGWDILGGASVAVASDGTAV